jgi:hypothetical protein
VSSKEAKAKAEIIRRLRLGNLRRLIQSRYGPTLPDDDAGREDLHELLLQISLGPAAGIKVPNAIAVYAKWMRPHEAAQLIDQINRTPARLRRSTARQLGQRQRVTNEQRERLRLWTIAPFDMTDAQLEEQRKAKARARERTRRQKAGSKPRETSIARTKPWKTEGISRRTWFRRHGNGHGTNSCEVKLTKVRTN